MKRLISYLLDDGSTITVEVDEPVEGGLVPMGRPGEIVTQAKQSFSEALNTILLKLQHCRFT